MGEDHGWYVVVVQLQVCFIIEQSVSQSPTCSDGYRGQESLAGNIPQGVEPGHVGVLVLVHQDVPGLVQVEAGVLTAETVSVRNSAHCPEENLSGGQFLSSVEADHQPLTGLLNSLNSNTFLNVDPTGLNLPRHGLANLSKILGNQRPELCLTYHLVEVPEDGGSSDTERGV